MPRPGTRQRLVYCDCLDCVDRAPTAQLNNDELATLNAVAQQLPPPKCILLVGSGLLRRSHDSTSVEECTLPHLDKAANEGCLGIAAVRSCTKTDVGGPGLSELAQLLDVHEQVTKDQLTGQPAGLVQPCTPLPSLTERFKGIQVVACSSSAAARGLLTAVGAQLPDQLQLHLHPAGTLQSADHRTQPGMAAAAAVGVQGEGTASTAAIQLTKPAGSAAASRPELGSSGAGWCGQAWGLPSPADLAMQLLAALGPGEGNTGPDMLLLHLDVQDMVASQAVTEPLVVQQAQTGQHEQQLQHQASTAEQAQNRQPQQQPQHASELQQEALQGQEQHQKQQDEQAVFEAACEGLLWIDALVAQLMRHKDVRERVLLSVMITPQGLPYAEGVSGGGTAKGPAGMPALQTQPLLPPGVLLDPRSFVVTPRDQTAMMRATPGMGVLDAAADEQDVCAVPRPPQSWQFKGMQPVDAAMDAPVLYLRRLPGIMRRDRAQHFSLQDAITRGALGGILIDRVLPDIAYKLGRALKYGA